MAKKEKLPAQLADAEIKRARTASVRLMPASGPVPVNPVSKDVQLTPIVQPVAFVPYSSQEQPLFIYDDESGEAPVEEASPAEEPAKPVERGYKKRAGR
jgi:hypothetical protein